MDLAASAGQQVFLSGLAYVLGERRPVAELAPEVGEDAVRVLGSQGVHWFRRSDAAAAELAEASLCETLRLWGRSPAKIDGVFYCSQRLPSGEERERLDQLFQTTKLLDMPTFGLSMQGCSGWASAIRLARALIRSGEARHIAVVTADVCNSAQERLTLHDAAILSDGAASCIVSADDGDYELLGLSQTANQRLWSQNRTYDDGMKMMMWARGVRGVFARAMEEAGRTEPPINAMVCTNLRTEVMSFFTAQCGLSQEGVFLGTLAEVSHVFGADPIINIVESRDWRRQRSADGGAPFLVLTLSPFNWNCFVLADRTPQARELHRTGAGSHNDG